MKTTRRNRPTQITDAPEHRAIPIERVEMRESDDNIVVLEGYASTFEEYDMYGGPSQYGWIERIDPKAFDVTLREKPDLHLLINHAGMPLARTKSGNLDLAADEHGLKVTARLDKRDPEVQSLAVKMERGDMDEMSFAFRVKAQEWRAAPGYEDIDDQSYRTITEISLHKGDVSVVNWGANPTTSVGIRSAADAIKVLAEAEVDELVEVRSEDGDLLVRAVEKLSQLVKPAGPTVNIENVNVRSDEEDTTETEEREEDAEDERPTEKPTFASQLAEIGAEALAEVFEGLTSRIAELEALVVGKAESERADDDDEEEMAEGHPEDCDCEDCKEEMSEDEPRSAPRLVEALAAQGILPEGKLPLSVYLAALN